mgnify:CR=1 FL=1
MALEQQIQKDIMEAMKAHDESRLNATRGIKSEILLAKTSGTEHELSDTDVLKIIQKLVKQRKESAELYTQGNRPEGDGSLPAEGTFRGRGQEYS